MGILLKLMSALLSVIMALGATAPFSPKEENPLLNVSILSDTHIDARLPLGQYLLARALNDIEGSEAPVDAVVIAGDLTNYGDGPSLDTFYTLFKAHCSAEHWVIAPGNHDIGHVKDVSQPEGKERIIQYYNDYTGVDIDNIYYSLDVKGYTFIVLSDQSDDSWDFPDIYDDQLLFLDAALAAASANNRPTFVVCHWPLEGVNGQSIIWEEGSLGTENSEKVRAILEKYNNVFFISGHLHAGINGAFTQTLFGFSCVEKRGGVTYVNLPTYLLVNRYGIPWGGLGFQMEVYQEQVVFRTRNFATSSWYPSYEFTVPLSGVTS